MREENGTDVDNQLFVYVNEIMSNIRFPMMNSRELTSLLLSPLVMKYKDFFMEKMAIGAAFNKGIYSFNFRNRSGARIQICKNFVLF